MLIRQQQQQQRGGNLPALTPQMLQSLTPQPNYSGPILNSRSNELVYAKATAFTTTTTTTAATAATATAYTGTTEE